MDVQAELKSMKEVLEALGPLDLDACKRVLDYGLTWAEHRERRRIAQKEMGAPIIEDISHR